MAVYALALGYSNGLAPLILGFVDSGQGWTWVFVSTHDILKSEGTRWLTSDDSTGVQYFVQPLSCCCSS